PELYLLSLMLSMSTIKNILNNITSLLSGTSSTPGLDALLILETVTQASRIQLLQSLSYSLSPSEELRAYQRVWQRKSTYPLAYTNSQKEFYGRTFRITPGVLVPRPETEDLVEHALTVITQYSTPPNIIEIGTGSGCICVSIAAETSHFTSFTAKDTSMYALQLASYNANIHNVRKYISFSHQSLLSAKDIDSVDVVVTNLPYLHQNKHTDDSIQTEPTSHLYSSKEGRGHYQALFRYLRSHFFHIPYVIGEALPEQIPKLYQDAQIIFSGKNVSMSHPKETVFVITIK
ncbi:MAG: HemK family protein methyltransferase, partial [Candidatus Paceibacteria bacterium]